MAANVLIWLQLMPCILKKKYVKNFAEPHNYEKTFWRGIPSHTFLSLLISQ